MYIATVTLTNCLHESGGGRVRLVCAAAGLRWFTIFIKRAVSVSNIVEFFGSSKQLQWHDSVHLLPHSPAYTDYSFSSLCRKSCLYNKHQNVSKRNSTVSYFTNRRLTTMTTTRKTMVTATTMPRIDVTYDAFPRSFAVFLACGPPLYSFRRANTTV